ncbi:MAG TPA: hypothetical protein VEG62_07630, partial [Acidimicrobiales bacterium]|nr:hypothetical protein [Acidimicrobiales bacterium]
ELVRRRAGWRAVVGVVVAPVGFVFWLLYSWRTVGTPIAFITAQKYWGESHFVWLSTPFESFGHMFTGMAAFKSAPDVLASVALIFMIAGLILLYVAGRRGVPVPSFWWVYAVGAVLGAMSTYWPSSILRYTLVLIPLLAAVAWRLRSSWTGAVVGAMAVMQGALAIMIFVATVYPQATLLSP